MFCVVNSIVNASPSVALVTLGVNMCVSLKARVPDKDEAKETLALPNVPLKVAVDIARAGFAV